MILIANKSKLYNSKEVDKILWIIIIAIVVINHAY